MELPKEQLNWPVGAPAETESFHDDMIIGGYNPNGTVPGKKQRGFLLSQIKLWLANVLVFLNGIKLNSNRITMQELTSGNLSLNNDWVTVAETDALNEAYTSEFIVSTLGAGGKGSIRFRASASNGGADGIGYKIEILMKSNSQATTPIIGVRMAKSTNSLTGQLAQVLIDSNPSCVITTQLVSNSSSNGGKGLFLVNPEIDNTPTLPDGVTAATFLEAGAELSLSPEGGTFNFIYGLIGIVKISDDAINITSPWGQTPKQGTGLVITLPDTALIVAEADGTGHTVTGSHTVSNFGIRQEIVSFRINQVGLFTGVSSDQILFWLSKGSLSKLTIT